jgi:uncharacterized coiled-coil protein SlyX
MSEDISQYKDWLKERNEENKRRRKALREAESRIKELEQLLAEKDQQINEYETALVELDDVRLDMEQQLQNIPQELEEFRQQAFLGQHKEAFQQMLGDSGLHPQASLEQLWQMVGYDPYQIEELTPELVNEVLTAARDQAPFLFMGKDVSQQMPVRQYQSGPQAAAMAAQNGFVQPSGFLRSPAVAQQASPMAPKAPEGWSSVAARGVPISPPTQAIQGRFQDSKWIAANQKAIAEAVESGAQFISSD